MKSQPPAPDIASLACREVRPLWTLGGAAAWLRRNQPELRRMIEDGRLEWCWDIASRKSRRREIRIWYRSMEFYKFRRQAPEKLPVLPPILPAPTVIAAVIGHRRPVLPGIEVQGILNCDRGLIARHLEAGDLLMANGHAGPFAGMGNRTPHILRASLESFLAGRRIG